MIISPQQSDDAQIVPFVVVPVFGTPLTRNGRFADAASTANTFKSQFFKDLPCEIVGFGVHVSYLGSGGFVLVPVFGTPLTRNGRFADAASTPNTLNSQFFNELSSGIVVFGVHFSYLAIPARAFLGDLPHNSFISLWVFFTPIRGTFYGLSWAILGPSWGRLSVPRRGPCTSRWTFLCFPMNLSG